jgi:pimeloyl-ACP methyl ester carboxylesterase
MAATAPFAAHRGAVSLVEGASPSWRRQLLALDVPRTVLFGAHSLPDPDTESLPARGVDVAVVSDAGHSMAWDNPAGLARTIANVCSRGTADRAAPLAPRGSGPAPMPDVRPRRATIRPLHR